jgi:hypothetical protein
MKSRPQTAKAQASWDHGNQFHCGAASRGGSCCRGREGFARGAWIVALRARAATLYCTIVSRVPPAERGSGREPESEGGRIGDIASEKWHTFCVCEKEFVSSSRIVHVRTFQTISTITCHTLYCTILVCSTVRLNSSGAWN